MLKLACNWHHYTQQDSSSCKHELNIVNGHFHFLGMHKNIISKTSSVENKEISDDLSSL